MEHGPTTTPQPPKGFATACKCGAIFTTTLLREARAAQSAHLREVGYLRPAAR
jgi:hypothetical protein